MASSYASGTINLTTAVVGSTITISGLSFQPKALRFSNAAISVASDNAGTDSAIVGIGFAVSTTERRCVASYSELNAATSICGSAAFNDCLMATIDGASGVTGKLDLSSITSDGFVLIIDDQFPSACRSVMWEAWGGSDITVAVVGDIAEPAATGNVDYTATGMVAGATDQVVMFAGVQSVAALNSVEANDAGLHVGFATVANNVTVCGNADDGSNTMDTDGYCRSGECLSMIINGGGNPNARATLTQFGTDNFRLNWAARATTNRRSIFMAIKGGNWTVGALTINGNTGSATATVSGLSYTPIGMSLIGRMTAESASATASAQFRLGFGSGTSTSDRRAQGVLDEDATANTETNYAIEYDSVLCYPSATGTLQAAYDINAMNSDGFQLIVDTAGGVASEWIGYLTFGNSVLSITATGISSAEAFGSTTLQYNQTLSPTGIASAEAIGSATVSVPLQITGTGNIASAESFGLRTNYILRSEEFDNAAWTKSAITVTANSTADPVNGAATADTLTPNTSNTLHSVEMANVGAARVQTSSIYAKASGYSWLKINSSGVGAWFDLTNGATGTNEGTSSQIVDVGGGWYRCSFVHDGITNGNTYFAPSNADGVTSFAGNGTSGIIVFGAQLEDGNGATAYIPTTSGSASVGATKLNLSLLSVGGIASAQAFGSAAVVPGPVTITPSAVGSAEAFGSTNVSAGVQNLTASGIATLEAFGSHTLTPGAVTVTPSGVAGGEAFGADVISMQIRPTGAASAEAFGTTVVVPGVVTVVPSGIASAQAFGSHTVLPGAVTVVVSGIASAQAFGTAQINMQIRPTGVTPAEAFGGAAVHMQLRPVALASGEAFGSASLFDVKLVIPSGVPGAEAFGLSTVVPGAVTLIITGIATAEVVGGALVYKLLPSNISYEIDYEQFDMAFGQVEALAMDAQIIDFEMTPASGQTLN